MSIVKWTLTGWLVGRRAGGRPADAP